MNTDKSAQECNGGFYNNPHKQPNYLSGKIIDGLNGKLFNRSSISYNSVHNKNQETDLSVNR